MSMDLKEKDLSQLKPVLPDQALLAEVEKIHQLTEPKVENVVKEEPVDSEKGRTWGETIVNDIKTEGKLPDWIKFMDKYMPPSIKAAMAVLETTQAITDNKDAIIDTGKLYVDVKLKQEKKELEKEALALEKDDTNKTGGAFTYEDCVF